MEKIVEKIALWLNPELKQIEAKIAAIEKQAQMSQKEADRLLKRGDVKATELKIREATLWRVAASELRSVERDVCDASAERIMAVTIAVALVTLVLTLVL